MTIGTFSFYDPWFIKVVALELLLILPLRLIVDITVVGLGFSPSRIQRNPVTLKETQFTSGVWTDTCSHM